MSIQYSYVLRCPRCQKILMGVNPSTCNKDIICSNCLKTGNVVYMVEEHNNVTYKHIGDGLFISKNKD